jgi:hypothetical protein
MPLPSPWEPEDADRLLWQAITLGIDAVISLRIVKQMFGQRAYLAKPVAGPARTITPDQPPPKRRKRAS